MKLEDNGDIEKTDAMLLDKVFENKTEHIVCNFGEHLSKTNYRH